MANLRTITNFKSALRGGGARPNLFEVDITGWPGSENMGDFNNDDKEEFQFLCKAAALPSSNITPIEIPFRGRTLKVAGDRTFDTWNITIINDENFRLRTKFEQWMNGINKLSDGSGATAPGSYMGNAVVHQLGRGANQGRNATTNSGGGDGSAGRADVTPSEHITSVTFSPLRFLRSDCLTTPLILLKSSLLLSKFSTGLLALTALTVDLLINAIL